MQLWKKSTLKAVQFLLLLISFQAFSWPRTEAVPGGVIDLALPYNEKQKPEVYYNKKRIAVVFRDKTWHAIIGLPIDSKPGPQVATIRLPIEKSIHFNLERKKYPEQRLTIKNKRLVTPLAADETRIESERQNLQRVFQHWSSADPFSKNFQAPLVGPITSEYGLRRFFNKIPGNPHLGLDIAAPMDTPIKSSAEGIVVMAEDLFYTGKTVIIEHGLGVFTLYGHMNKIKVQKGRHVSSGSVIGLVGQTGRATGPHLHWGMILNQAKVQPLLFVNRKQILPKPKPKPAVTS